MNALRIARYASVLATIALFALSHFDAAANGGAGKGHGGAGKGHGGRGGDGKGGAHPKPPAAQSSAPASYTR